MYVPKHFKKENSDEILNFIRDHGFATLVSKVENKLWASHIPLHLVKTEKGTYLQGHVAKANPQWKEIQSDQEILAIFLGPHGYISPSWYDHENVPTWNYTAVHVYGTLRLLDGDELISSLRNLMQSYESGQEMPRKFDDMDSDFIKDHLRGLVGFEIEVREIHAADKLSQNRDDKNYGNIIDELNSSGDANAYALAKLMRSKREER